MYLVTAREMQDMDRTTIESFGIPGRVLMENAGRGATQMLFDTFPDIRTKKVGYKTDFLFKKIFPINKSHY